MLELKRFETLLKQGKITRREFVRYLSALGITAAASPLIMPSSVVAATPKKGGRFRMGITGGSTTDSLDGGMLNDAMNYNVSWQIRNCLVEVDHKGRPTPELAESWEATDGAKTWTFKLRKGVEFHNGKTMDADDVVYSINHHRGEDSKSAAKGIVTPITDVNALDKNTVQFKLNGGNADFPFIASDYHLTIVPKGTKGKDFDKGIGTGGFMLKKWEPGVRALVQRNPNYFKEGRAHFDEVETIHIKDTSARTNALKTGQIDFMNNIEIKMAHLLKRSPGIKVVTVPGTFHNVIPMRTDTAPFDNNDVRLAFKYAINRQQMVDVLFKGYGSAGNDHPIGQNQRFFAKDLPQREQNPDKVKFHLKKAGMQNETFKVHTSELGSFRDQAVLFKEQAKKAGLKIDLVNHPADGYWSKVWMQVPISFSYWAGRESEDSMFTTAYSSGASWNESYWDHKRFNELLVAARAELDLDKRRVMYAEMQQLCRDEGGTIVHSFEDWTMAMSDKVQHGTIAGNWSPDGARAAERWWFA